MPDETATSDEAALVDALKRGEEPAFELLVRRYGGRMLAVAKRIVKTDAEAQDCVQDAFLNAFRKIGEFEGRAALSTWLHQIVVNAALMRLRGKARRSERPIEDLLPVFDEDDCRIEPNWRVHERVDDALARADIREAILSHIGELPEAYRIVLYMRDIEELDTRTVAERLGISEGSVKMRLHRARAALKKLLEPLFEEGAL